MRLAGVIVASALALGCAAALWRPPVDEVSVDVAPGLFGWVEANKRLADGRWGRRVAVIVRVAGPRRLAGAECAITLNGERTYRFRPNDSQTWELSFVAAEGDHTVVVEVGDVVRRRRVYVWRLPSEGAIN